MDSIALACKNRIQIKKEVLTAVQFPRKAFLVMKLTVLLLIIACLQAEAGTAQKMSLSVKNAALKQVLQSIEEETGYHFLYTNEMLQDTKKVTLDLHDVPLDELLTKVFDHQPLTYTLFEKTVIVKTRALSGESAAAGVRLLSPPG